MLHLGMWRADLTGQRFGSLVVERYNGRNKHKQHIWVCRCDCGGESSVATTGSLRYGNTKSCGCGKSAQSGKNLLTHGLTNTRAHAIWKAAKQRCFNPAASNYRYYGGRGITMCPAWADDFAEFYRAMGDCPPGMSLDRIDNDKGYEPGNCRWATQAEQTRNWRGRNVLVEHEGKTMVLKDYCALMGVSYGAVMHRRKAGQTPVAAAEALLAKRLERPPHHQNNAAEA